MTELCAGNLEANALRDEGVGDRAVAHFAVRVVAPAIDAVGAVVPGARVGDACPEPVNETRRG